MTRLTLIEKCGDVSDEHSDTSVPSEKNRFVSLLNFNIFLYLKSCMHFGGQINNPGSNSISETLLKSQISSYYILFSLITILGTRVDYYSYCREIAAIKLYRDLMNSSFKVGGAGAVAELK
ncbi:hypothetical protein RF11_09912 [Thelohanellus kitauei]|uniref:Uncharacterized protein n=1 Tax=Thelohanellus kitauei TaxID=669202 RepID=A0A0C2MYN0_THEKT|nr:hypothetical protein RF11_09912 [Thelohanellus kitauei]